MKTFSEKAVEEFDEKIWGIRIRQILVNEKVINLFRQLLVAENQKQRGEYSDKLLKALGLTIKDLPAFPPKDIDLFDLILKVGVEKIKREQREEIKKIIKRVVLEEAVIKFNSTPEIGEKFNPEKHNHTNKLLNEMNSFIYDELIKNI